MKSPEGENAVSDMRQVVDHWADRFEAAWSRGTEPDLTEFLQQAQGPARRLLAIELVHLDLEWSQQRGKLRTLEYYSDRVPELLQSDASLPNEIVDHFRLLQNATRDEAAPPESCTTDPFKTVSPVFDPAAAEPADAVASLPARIGRYRVERILGKGGFGCVYLAHDEQLGRHVAVKVPHSHLVSRPTDAQLYAAEARTVAGLDHPHIVPVYDVGSTPDCPFFVVSKYIEGADLATRLARSRLSHLQAADLVAKIADGLHYAHKQGLVHRDVKPGNILVATDGQPFLVDFGLALREQDAGRGQRYAGTPAYFSPEQARGEGHRVDGRSDIFSLGTVLYELLVGKRPFRADSQRDLLDQISLHEPRPPRQHDESIPKELERICFKALAKRASERYSSAHDLAEDLRHFLASVPQTALDRPSWTALATSNQTNIPTPGPLATPATPPSDSQPIRIIPKGLRSFDAHDADFFLELLPGPRDREGLPDSLRFWKTKIEESDPDRTFSIGLIYGPSGCGKSSLVSAGLLPRLSPEIASIPIEATADQTEARLLAALRRRFPALGAGGGLKEALAALRRGEGIPTGKKVLIILDQFEQWLHAQTEATGAELVQALRHCDGIRVQAIVMVRDDFWMAATRFMRDLEVRLLEGQNSAAVDLFDRDHARKVLAAFGRSFGKFPESAREASREQQEFLKQAVAGLAQEGKIICVRLALFAEMMKGKAWTPASLQQVGGAEGVGVAFLEETFSAATAPPEHRLHQKAARGVLQALLPESGADIKGHMRSHEDLLEASAYAHRPKDFQDLIRILNSELRLITPTDPEGKEPEDEADSRPEQGARYYQLTHDYLVPSLRDWLTRKQKETRKGRAELRLAQRADSWSRKPENRHLPAWWEWLSIRLLTRRRDWTPSQQQMMTKADRFHALRGTAAFTLLLAAVLTAWIIRRQSIEHSQATIAAGQVRRLLDAQTERVPEIIEEMRAYHLWAEPLLQEAHAEAVRNEAQETSEADRARHVRRRLHASLALLPGDPDHVKYLYGRMLSAQPREVTVIADALQSHREELVDPLWRALEQPEQGHEGQRLRAACALALYDASSARWDSASAPVVNQLVQVNPAYLSDWMAGLRPVRHKLLEPLIAVFHDRGADQVAERTLATSILADYARNELDVLANLAMDADERQFVVLFPRFAEHAGSAISHFEEELTHSLAETSAAVERDFLARRQANAGVGLLLLNRPQKVWPLLRHRPDPSVRSYLIHRLAPLGVGAPTLMEQLQREKEVSIRMALLLSLGEFAVEQLPLAERKRMVSPLLQIYGDDSDPGIHGAAAWVVRQWNHQDRLQEIDGKLATGRVEGKRDWYVNRQGQTLSVIRNPVEFVMGSPTGEEGRAGGREGKTERQHKQAIPYSFAMAAQEVTTEQFLRFRPDHIVNKQYAPTGDCPVNSVSGYDAAAYCNWLSEREHIRPELWCYLPGDGMEPGAELKLAPDYLNRTGYRLPSEPEWEYACRAGAETRRFYGEAEQLLPKYAWYVKGSGEDWTIPVGRRKPNELGLFDMLGNAWERCQDRYTYYPPDVDAIGGQNANGTFDQVMRGGSIYRVLSLRSADREGVDPAQRHNYIGFRVARTHR